MKTKKIAITGGPATGKSSIVEHLVSKGFYCMKEISRALTLKAQKEGVDQLFLKDPLWFSEQLLELRVKQFNKAHQSLSNLVFFDRGLIDIVAYLDYINCEYSNKFKLECKKNRYDKVFILNPWKAIYTQDNERYETFKQSTEIHKFLVKWYNYFDYKLIEVPQLSVEERVAFILENS